MEITWLGHSCFRIKGKDVTFVTDPFDKAVGGLPPKLTANVVTVSHNHPGHNNIPGVGGSPRVFKGPGEYETLDVFVNGLPSFHDGENGAQRGKNTIYLVRMEEVSLCHLGDLGHLLTPSQVQTIGAVDVLFLPVGGLSTLNALLAAQTVRTLSPKVVLPMHYKTQQVTWLEPLDNFLREIGSPGKAAQPKLLVSKTNVPQELQVTVLEAVV